MVEKIPNTSPLSSLSPRTDLATECLELNFGKSKPDIDGLTVREGKIADTGFHILEILNDEGAIKLGKPKGKYITLDIGKLTLFTRDKLEQTADTCARFLTELFPKNTDSCLLACLGNRKITADAQGPMCAEHFIVSRHIKESNPLLFSGLDLCETMCIVPNVLGNTGIEAATVIKGAVDKTKPSFVIAVDSLCARKASRVATTLQMSNAGIAPGSGVGNHRTALNSDTLGVPVISIGIPTVVDAVTVGIDILEECFSRTENSYITADIRKSILSSILESSSYGYFVTPKNADAISYSAAKLIAMTVNKALNPTLSYGEMEELKP